MNCFHTCNDKSNLTRRKFININHLGCKISNFFHRIFCTGCNKMNLLTAPQHTIHNTHQNHNPKVRIIPRIHQQRPCRRIFITMWCRQFMNDFFQQFGHTRPSFARYRNCIGGIQPNHIRNLGTGCINITGWQINLV